MRRKENRHFLPMDKSRGFRGVISMKKPVEQSIELFWKTIERLVKAVESRINKLTTKSGLQYGLIFVFVPFFLLIDKTGKDKTSMIMPRIWGVFCLWLLYDMVFHGRGNFICVVGWIALNVWSWLTIFTGKK